MDKYDKLKEVKDLLDKGLINQEEFDRLKNEILFNTKTNNNSTLNQTKIVNTEHNINSSIPSQGTVNNVKKFYIFFIILFCILIIGLNLKNNSSKIKEEDEGTEIAPNEVVVNPEPAQQPKSYEQIQRDEKRKQLLQQQELEIARIRAQNQILSNMRKNGASVEDVARTTDGFNSK